MDDQCCATILSDWGMQQCSRKAKVEEDGSSYCKQHAPSALQARRAVSDASFHRNMEIARVQQRRSKLGRLAFDAIASGGQIDLDLTAKIKACAAELAEL